MFLNANAESFLKIDDPHDGVPKLLAPTHQIPPRGGIIRQKINDLAGPHRLQCHRYHHRWDRTKRPARINGTLFF